MEPESHSPPFQGLTAVFLVRLVLAVCTAITDPAAMNALAAATVEFQGGARAATGDRGSVAAPAVLGPLVRAVLTVVIPVAGPQAGDTAGGVAAEMSGAAGGGLAVGLVRAIQAVSVLVTHKLLGDALAILAAELIQGARLGGCGVHREESTLSRHGPSHHTSVHSQTGSLGLKGLQPI